MKRPWWHPLIMTVSVAMFAMMIHLLINVVYAVGFEMAASAFPEGSWGRMVNEDVVKQDYVSNWPGAAANAVWISIFTAAVLLALRSLRLHLVRNRMLYVETLDVSETDVMTLSEDEFKELDQWVNKSVVSVGVIGRPWS